MKKFKLFLFVVAIATLISGFCALGCNGSDDGNPTYYTVTPDASKSLTLKVGDTVDFTQYFTVKDADGNSVSVTADMLDLTYVDMTKPGGFMVVLNYKGSSGSLWFTVVSDGSGNQGGNEKVTYTLSVDATKSKTLNVGDNVDFTQYFKISGSDGSSVKVTAAMLDLTKVDLTKAGSFTVTLNYSGQSASSTFTVKSSGGSSSETVDLSSVFSQYTDISKWNFAITASDSDGGEEYYEYLGDNILYEHADENYNTCTEYFVLGMAETYFYYKYNSNDTYTMYDELSTEFEYAFSYSNVIFLSELSKYTFTQSSGYYVAENANEAGNSIIGEYDQYTWTKIAVYITNGKVTKIEGTQNDGYVMTFEISKYGQINFSLPDASQGGNDNPSTEPTGEMMEKQTYDAATFDKDNLQDKLTKYTDPSDTSGEPSAIGLPSTGNYNALVVPVQFNGDTISSSDLTKLNKAFNGTSADTGWESVKTYYQKASYGKLNISFDIHSVCSMNYNSSYYENLTATDADSGQKYSNGDNVILHEVLSKLDSSIDFTKYDTNGDGCIDAVYLIYSAPVDYDSNDSFYWAYVTWDSTENKYDGLYAYYYLFAGFDFMDEGSDNNGSMTINTETYIHETGHLLGLDDYYDYDTNTGSNQGFGGGAMMDYNVGDHDAYSKIMLGWVDATIVNSTQTVTIKSLQEKGDVILIPLNFNNSYFCEYLLIDLYSAAGVNELRSKNGSTILYGGADYGVRIYHISSSIDNPYNENDTYGSFTDCNNSTTSKPLMKLVEADGGNSKFTDTDGLAVESDLWQAGDTFSTVFPSYTRNNGDAVNFDISINSVSATEASITVTFKN